MTEDPRASAQASRSGPREGANAAASSAAERRPRPRLADSRRTCSNAARRRKRRRIGHLSAEPAGALRVADKVGAVVAAAPSGGLACPSGAGPGGHTQRLLTVVKSGSIQDVKAVTGGQGPHLAASARRRVRGGACMHGVDLRVLDLRARTAARTRQHERRHRTRRRPLGTSSACRNC